MIKIDEIQGAQGKSFEPYYVYGEEVFPQGIQRFSQGKKKSGKKFRIVAALGSSFHAVVRDFYSTPLV